MTTELRVRSQAQSLYVRALSQAWRNGIQLYDPSVWLVRDPEVEEKMLRDADIAHAIDYRRHLIAGRQWTLLPRLEGSPRAELSVAVGTELLEGIRHFTGARLNLARAFFSGSRFARIHVTPRQLKLGDGRERTWLVPERLEDLDKRMFRVVPKTDGKKIDAHWEMWSVARQDWFPQSRLDDIFTIRHVYQDDQASLGHGRALREALGWWWYTKTHVFEESVQAVERFAQGLATVKVDGLRDAESGRPNTEVINEWVEAIEKMMARHVMVYDAADQIEIVQNGGEGWQLLKDMRDELKAAITTLVLGSNLPTTADKGGSYALGSIQQDSTEALIQFDRETLEETLTDDLLGCVWYINHANLVEMGIEEEKPRFSINQDKLEDPQKRAQVAQTLNNMGIDLSLEDVLEQTGFRKPTPGEDVVAGRDPLMDAGQGFLSSFGDGGGNGGDEKPKDDKKDGDEKKNGNGKAHDAMARRW